MPIGYLEESRIFAIRTERSSYLFGINDSGTIQHLYWGFPVHAGDCSDLLRKKHHSSFDAAVDRETEEYGGWGGYLYAEPALKATFGDGVRDLKLRYEGFSIDKPEELVIRLADEHYALKVNLHYHVFPEYDLIERYVTVTNGESSAVRIEQVMSAIWSVLSLPAYRMTHVTGRWAGEYQLRSDVLSEGKKVLESRRGFTGPHANPWFAIDDGTASETHGSVWFGALGWSGNWKIAAEKTTFGHLRVTGGINDFDGSFLLAPGETFTSPVFTGGYSTGGFGGMSRNLHRYQKETVLPGSRVRKVLYNSWEATEFAVNVQDQKALARKAAGIGVELFVVDDGWFGARNSDRAGLGDWQVNPEKFPNGLNELIDEVNSLGMDFGIWVEPESVNPDSDLYRAHPEWVYQFKARTGSQLRNQLLLNLGLPEVKQYVLDFMTELLGTYDISFIKWDMNRTVTEPGIAGEQQQSEHSDWIRHVNNLYDIWHKLRLRFPNVEFETCAGGGARIDLGILRYADQAWISDNTDALDRLHIQEGFTYAYDPSVMMCWVTESPHGMNGRRLPLSFRFHSAMMGGLGIGANIDRWSEEELAEAKDYVEQYKRIRSITMHGDLYRLSSLRHSNVAACQYVARDGKESVVFALRQAQHFGAWESRLTLQGLDPDAVYKVDAGDGRTVTQHGSFLMQVGVAVGLSGDFQSRMIRIARVEN
ncbi:alpha-galactosidase [Paenibacillus taihuensis]|uniref:Alpha-galactosidase n=1 Tax=Paenibacillus taihuensis TaxID=1156355 RepID=A0A3D9SDG5_9BACL|nr:alpha-galactosidase [Paenibacillus taihuensis]REE87440.1 alpha-galactosidase [Paenibacillus taihuensis]